MKKLDEQLEVFLANREDSEMNTILGLTGQKNAIKAGHKEDKWNAAGLEEDTTLDDPRSRLDYDTNIWTLPAQDNEFQLVFSATQGAWKVVADYDSGCDLFHRTSDEYSTGKTTKCMTRCKNESQPITIELETGEPGGKFGGGSGGSTRRRLLAQLSKRHVKKLKRHTRVHTIPGMSFVKKKINKAKEMTGAAIAKGKGAINGAKEKAQGAAAAAMASGAGQAVTGAVNKGKKMAGSAKVKVQGAAAAAMASGSEMAGQAKAAVTSAVNKVLPKEVKEMAGQAKDAVTGAVNKVKEMTGQAKDAVTGAAAERLAAQAKEKVRASKFANKTATTAPCDTDCELKMQADKKSANKTIINPDTGISYEITGNEARCRAECSNKRVCTGAPGLGLQQLTRFTDDPGGGDGLPAVPLRGSFHRIPTSTHHTRVFATGKCYECKIGIDGHFRCPVKGRRRVLTKFPFIHLNLTEQQTVAVANRIDATLFGGADLCFDVEPQKGLQIHDDAEPDEMIKAKSAITVVVCNERLEVPASRSASQEVYGKQAGTEFTVRYAATMMLEGAFHRSWVNGLAMSDPDVRVFHYGFDIAIPPPPSAESDTADPLFYKLAPYFNNTAKAADATVDQCAFISGDVNPSPYRSMLVELYTKYMRAGAKERGRNKPCKLVPNLDYRDDGFDPSEKTVEKYPNGDPSIVKFLGRNISLQQGRDNLKEGKAAADAKAKADRTKASADITAAAAAKAAADAHVVPAGQRLHFHTNRHYSRCRTSTARSADSIGVFFARKYDCKGYSQTAGAERLAPLIKSGFFNKDTTEAELTASLDLAIT